MVLRFYIHKAKNGVELMPSEIKFVGGQYFEYPRVAADWRGCA